MSQYYKSQWIHGMEAKNWPFLTRNHVEGNVSKTSSKVKYWATKIGSTLSVVWFGYFVSLELPVSLDRCLRGCLQYPTWIGDASFDKIIYALNIDDVTVESGNIYVISSTPQDWCNCLSMLGIKFINISNRKCKDCVYGKCYYMST